MYSAPYHRYSSSGLLGNDTADFLQNFDQSTCDSAKSFSAYVILASDAASGRGLRSFVAFQGKAEVRTAVTAEMVSPAGTMTTVDAVETIRSGREANDPLPSAPVAFLLTLCATTVSPRLPPSSLVASPAQTCRGVLGNPEALRLTQCIAEPSVQEIGSPLVLQQLALEPEGGSGGPSSAPKVDGGAV